MCGVSQCPKCGGEMRRGEIISRVITPGFQSSSGFSMMGMPGMRGVPSALYETEAEEKIQWREKTGQKTGLIIKRDDEKPLPVSGQRCIKCGYTELYVQEHAASLWVILKVS